MLTFLQMLVGAFGAIERLLVLIGPIALAAYALPATERFTNAWLKLMLSLLAVRFAWTIVFILFSIESLLHVQAGNPTDRRGHQRHARPRRRMRVVDAPHPLRRHPDRAQRP
jgi:hypothetical protein